MDEIIYQINKTKKMFIMMIVTIIVIVPVAIVVIFATFGPPFAGGGGGWWWHNGGGGSDGVPPGPPTFGPAFEAVRLLITVVVLVWLVLGIRQWFILSKWTKKYKTYKELQKKIEDKLDFEKGEGEEGRGGNSSSSSSSSDNK
jgi:cell division protein FtsL